LLIGRWLLIKQLIVRVERYCLRCKINFKNNMYDVWRNRILNIIIFKLVFFKIHQKGDHFYE